MYKLLIIWINFKTSIAPIRNSVFFLVWYLLLCLGAVAFTATDTDQALKFHYDVIMAENVVTGGGGSGDVLVLPPLFPTYFDAAWWFPLIGWLTGFCHDWMLILPNVQFIPLALFFICVIKSFLYFLKSYFLLTNFFALNNSLRFWKKFLSISAALSVPVVVLG